MPGREVLVQAADLAWRRPRRRARVGSARWVLAAIAALVAVFVAAPPSTAHPPAVFKITDSRISKPAGLATDAAHHRYWTVNRSGTSGRVFALNGSGDVEGSIELHAHIQDISALHYHNGSLYLADIGDHAKNRNKITVYVVRNPEPDGSRVTYQAYDFQYLHHPRDARVLLVDGNARMSVITRGAHPGIYRAPADPSRSSINPLTRAGPAPKHITGGLQLGNGKIAVRDPVAVRILDPARHDKVVAQAATPKNRSGKALGRRPDGKLLLVDGSQHARVYAMPVPKKIGNVPKLASRTTASSPSTSSTASSSASPRQDVLPPNANAVHGIKNWGIIIAVIVAALVASAAGLMTYLTGGRSRK